MFSILWWLVSGLVIGLIARAILPGRQKMGLVTTTLLGIGGSLLGGTVVSVWHGDLFGGLSGTGFVGSLIGALVLLVIGGQIQRSSRSE